MTNSSQHIKDAAAFIQSELPGFSPKIAVILGSGLGAVADLLDEKARIPYTDLPGFPRPTVAGHEGLMRLGTVGSTDVIFMKGRVHLYEGTGVEPLKVMIRTLKTLGIENLVLTNAAGSLQRDYPAGSLMAITDHINLSGTNPLLGLNDDEWGPRFQPMEDAWNPELREKLFAAASATNIRLGQGVYAHFLGPTFETPAEIRMAKTIGADLVGMSTVPENIIANHCGLKVVGCSAVTNLGAGMDQDEKLSHDHTLVGAAKAEKDMAKLLGRFIADFS